MFKTQFLTTLSAGAVIALWSAGAMASDKVICTSETPNLIVKKDDLKATAFSADPFEALKVFQGENVRKDITENDEKVTYVKVQFTEREEEENEVDGSIGWIRESIIKERKDCAGAQVAEQNPDETDGLERRPLEMSGSNITGLTSSACCTFPLEHKPTHSYSGEYSMRIFGARRSGGRRLHAACDLYQANGAKVMSVAKGQLLSGLYYFYQGTYALEVRHVSGFVVRYGEINRRVASRNIRAGRQVAEGQHLGFVEKVNSGCCKPMLHFELYSGKGRGPLSTRGNRFQRRADLMNPTQHLLRWEAKSL